MPRFFLQLRNANDGPDDVGRDLPDIEAAREGAARDLRELICDEIRQGKLDLGHVIDITDDQGRPVAAVQLSDAVELLNYSVPAQKCMLV